MPLTLRIASIRKALVTLVGIVSALLTANLLPAEWAPYVSTAVAIATVVLTYQVPNATPTFSSGYDEPGDHAAPEK